MQKVTLIKSAGITTAELASAIGINPESIRVHLCKNGTFHGIKPGKLR